MVVVFIDLKVLPPAFKRCSILIEDSFCCDDQNEVCRGSLYENQRWSVVATLFGLLGCSVAVSLKAELLLTLAALSQTPLIAATVWHSLEASQVSKQKCWLFSF